MVWISSSCRTSLAPHISLVAQTHGQILWITNVWLYVVTLLVNLSWFFGENIQGMFYFGDNLDDRSNLDWLSSFHPWCAPDHMSLCEGGRPPVAGHRVSSGEPDSQCYKLNTSSNEIQAQSHSNKKSNFYKNSISLTNLCCWKINIFSNSHLNLFQY